MNNLILTGFALSFVFSILTLLSIYGAKRREKIRFGQIVKQDSVLLTKLKFLNEFHKKMELFLIPNEKEHLASTYVWTVIGLCLFSGIYLLIKKQVILGIVFPIIFFQFVGFCITSATRQAIDDIEEQLPQAIDSIILTSSRYNDLKTVLYKASIRIDKPMKSILETIALQMNAGDPKKILLEIGNRYNNIWVWSFVLILISSIEEMSQEEVIESLRNLRNLLENENQTQKQSILERKYSITINYVLIFVSFGIFILNLIFNPIAESFFFGSIGGLGALISGFTCIFLTIVINIRLTYKRTI